MAVIAATDAVITDGDAEDIGREVAERGAAVADGLGVDNAVLVPGRGIDAVEQAGLLDGSRNLARKIFGPLEHLDDLLRSESTLPHPSSWLEDCHNIWIRFRGSGQGQHLEVRHRPNVPGG